MSKLNRVLWSGLVLVGAAACGDDVTIQPPPPPPEPGVRAVTVAPDGATVQVGATLTFTAAVTLDPGAAAATIAWSSSATAIATVDPTSGVATGVAPGSVGIRATATSGTSSASGVATLNVSNVPTVTPATVSIQSIEKGGVPQNLNGLDGQVDVRVNLDRGGEQVQTVQLLIDGAVVTEQVFASPQVQGSAPELVVEEIVFSWNTAAFNAATGVPNHLNGPHAVSAKVITAQNAAGTGSPNVNVVLDNENSAVITVEISNGASIGDAEGLTWYTGDATAHALPVIYSTAAPVIANVVFNPSNPLNTQVDATAPYSANWPKGTPIGPGADEGGSGGNGLPGVEDDEFEVCVSAVVNGNPVQVGCSDEIRYDNNGPDAPEFAMNPNLRQNGWINPGVGLTGRNGGTAVDNDWIVFSLFSDDGVGTGAGSIFLRIDGTAPVTVDAALAATASNTPALPAPSLNNNSYCAVASERDLLGNESLLPAAGTLCLQPLAPSFAGVGTLTAHLRFGVDIAAPTAAFPLGPLSANQRINGAAVGGEFVITVSDTGTVGNSGMLTGNAVRGTVQIRSQSLTPPSATSCYVGLFALGACGPVSVNLAPPFPLVPTTTVGVSDTVGYYTYSATAQDAAGNQSAALTRVIAFDQTANVPALTGALFNVPITGSTATFNALASDNFDLWKVDYILTYGGGFAGPLVYPSVVLNAFNSATLLNSNVPAGITIGGFVRQIEAVTGNAPLATGGIFSPTSLSGTATDQANLASAAAVTPIPGAAVPQTPGYMAFPAAQLVNSWAITEPAVAKLVSTNQGPAAPVNPLSVAINVDAFGPTATFNAPFVRVDFYALVAGNLQQIGSTTAFSTVDDGSANGRRHRYTFTWTPGTSVPLGAQTIYAVGVNATGAGLVTQANALITTTNP